MPLRRKLDALSRRASAERLRQKMQAWHDWASLHMLLARATVKCMQQRYLRRPLRAWRGRIGIKATERIQSDRASQHHHAALYSRVSAGKLLHAPAVHLCLQG